MFLSGVVAVVLAPAPVSSSIAASTAARGQDYAGAAAMQTFNDLICCELSWECVPLVVETFGAWGRTAGQFFAQLAVQFATQGNSTKATMLNSVYSR